MAGFFDNVNGNLGFGGGNASYSPNQPQTQSQPAWQANNPFLGSNNPYLQSNIDATMGDMTRNYNLMVKPNTESAMAQSGSFGNSGLEQMQQNQQQNLMDSMGKTAAGMRMQDYNNQQNMYQWDQGFNRSLYNDSYDQNMGNAQLARGLLNDANGWNQQDINNSSNIQNTPLQYLSNFTNIANGIGGQGASSTTQMPGNPMLGALGGWSLGSALGKGFNSSGA